MTTRRMARVAEAIRESVSTTILHNLRDPRVKHVTVISAEATHDLRAAKIYVSVMGTPKEQSLSMHGLESARGFIQAKLAERLQTRNTPVIKFVLDPGVKQSIETARLLRELGDAPATEDDAEDANEDDTRDEVGDDLDADELTSAEADSGESDETGDPRRPRTESPPEES